MRAFRAPNTVNRERVYHGDYLEFQFVSSFVVLPMGMPEKSSSLITTEFIRVVLCIDVTRSCSRKSWLLALEKKCVTSARVSEMHLCSVPVSFCELCFDRGGNAVTLKTLFSVTVIHRDA